MSQCPKRPKSAAPAAGFRKTIASAQADSHTRPTPGIADLEHPQTSVVFRECGVRSTATGSTRPARSHPIRWPSIAAWPRTSRTIGRPPPRPRACPRITRPSTPSPAPHQGEHDAAFANRQRQHGNDQDRQRHRVRDVRSELSEPCIRERSTPRGSLGTDCMTARNVSPSTANTPTAMAKSRAALPSAACCCQRWSPHRRCPQPANRTAHRNQGRPTQRVDRQRPTTGRRYGMSRSPNGRQSTAARPP